jgi:hypothetical protein
MERHKKQWGRRSTVVLQNKRMKIIDKTKVIT